MMHSKPTYHQHSCLWTVALLLCLSYQSYGFNSHTNNLLNRNIRHSSFLSGPSSFPTTFHRTTSDYSSSFRNLQKDLEYRRRLSIVSSSAAVESITAVEGVSQQTSGLFQTINHKRKLWLGGLSVPPALSALSRPSKATIVKSAKVFALLYAVVAVISNIKTRKRQAVDATSEWQRYAKNPGARGRAIMVMSMKQLLFITAAKLLSIAGKKSRAASIRKHAGRQFSNGILKLGPLYIKLGQIVSCRPGLLGKEWVDALEDLQDRVPARTGQDALELAYSALDGGKEEFDRVFVDFDSTPIAAASLGQVHRAKLRENGNEVALKVQRPFLKLIYDQDFALLTTIAKWIDRFAKAGKVGGVESSWTQIFSDAEEILYREIDYRDEADNQIRFANDFGIGIGGVVSNLTSTALARNNEPLPSAAGWLRTPYVYSELSNKQLLVQEYVPSFKVTDNEKLDANNVSEEDRVRLADDLARAYLRQFCSNLFFSTDPHPGNIGVEMVQDPQTAKPKPRLVLYDFGQASSLTQNQADGILEIIEAIIDTDVDRSITAFQKMGVLVDGADLDQVRKKVAENYRTGKIKADRKKLKKKGYKFVDEFAEEGDDEKKKKESSNATTSSSVNGADIDDETKVRDSEVMSYFTLPAEYAFVARAITQMDGVGKSLDPDFDFISNSAPYIVEIKGTDLYLKDEASKVFRPVTDNLKKFLLGLEENIREVRMSL